MRGRVRLAPEEPLPPPEPALSSDPCEKHADRAPRDLAVDPETRGVADAIVWLEGVEAGGAPAPAPRPAVLDQRGCEFVPRAQVVPLGSELAIRNSDPELHNVRGQTAVDGRTLFNVGMAPGNPDLPIVLRHAGLIRVSCGVHSWMGASILVAPHAFAAVTDARGAFAMPAPAPGRYTLRVFHERLGERSLPLDVPAGDAPVVEAPPIELREPGG